MKPPTRGVRIGTANQAAKWDPSATDARHLSGAFGFSINDRSKKIGVFMEWKQHKYTNMIRFRTWTMIYDDLW